VAPGDDECLGRDIIGGSPVTEPPQPVRQNVDVGGHESTHRSALLAGYWPASVGSVRAARVALLFEVDLLAKAQHRLLADLVGVV
jgi:hypothetical protein